MYRITKEFHFSASHQLSRLPETHQCARLHGHNYIAVIELRAASLDVNNFVRDYGELSELKAYIDGTLDHRHLNDVFDEDAVTAEYIAKHLFDWCKARWPETGAVRVSETPKTWAVYEE